MRKLLFLSLLLAPVLGGSALAQIDPDADGIGLYGDTDAQTNTLQASTGSQAQIYLLLTRPSASGGIAGWECGVVPPDNVTLLGWQVPYTHSNIGSGNDFVVGCAEVLNVAQVVILASTTVLAGDASPGAFYLTPGPRDEGDDGLPNYLDAGNTDELVALHAWPQGMDAPVFVLNGNMGDEEATTWGNVKSLYRHD